MRYTGPNFRRISTLCQRRRRCCKQRGVHPSMGKKFGNDLFLPYYQGRDDTHEGRARGVPEIHRDLLQTPEAMERSAQPLPTKTP